MKTIKPISMLALFMVVAKSGYAQSKPNIVLVLGDNLGYGELGSDGGGITRGTLM